MAVVVIGIAVVVTVAVWLWLLWLSAELAVTSGGGKSTVSHVVRFIDLEKKFDDKSHDLPAHQFQPQQRR